jgi:DNA-nicking Smr family endonuclease
MRNKRKRGARSRNSDSASGPAAADPAPAVAPEIGITIGALLKGAGLDRLVREPPPVTLPPPGPATPSLVPEPIRAAPGPRPRADHSAGEFAALNQAYRGVAPIERPKRGRAVAQSREPRAVAPRAPGPDDEAARERLSALVAGGQRFRVERDEGWVRGLCEGTDPRSLRQLASARFAPEAELDLHGLRREDARRKVREFVRAQHRRGARYLLLIVGKGTHSENGIGVLGDALIEELIGGVVAPLVGAFASAHVQHGGEGAVAVRLK